MDSLRLDISVDERSDRDFAEKLAVDLLQLLRWKSDQWWIMRSVQPLLGYVRNDFPVDERGIPNTDFNPSPHTRGHTPYGFEQPITQEMWQEVLQL
jgi:hypothetical protein